MRLLLFLFIVTGCAEDFSGGTRWLDEVQEEEQIAPPPQTFNTRLTPTLLVSGEICQGDETILVDNIFYNCDPLQYLVKIDNVNTCDSSGRCTGFEIKPFIADLIKNSTETPGFSVFDIDQDSPTTGEQEDVLDTVGVKSDVNGNAFVFFKTKPLERGD